ncbi:MAG: UV DNA damage repair endonuclease UvsE [Lentisphaeria bacterium]|nr:UV DNA damage repair endonuclease UvsE [Lentisphaeria bacterium]
MIDWGLCCLFLNEDLKFRTTRYSFLQKKSRLEQLAILSGICRDNSQTLLQTLQRLPALNIQAFRISSELFPLYTHPDAGYPLHQLPDGEEILQNFAECRAVAKRLSIRLSLHPDQFVVLVSPHEAVLKSSLAELEYQLVLAELSGAEEINLHLGGSYGDKAAAMARFEKVFAGLPEGLQQRLTLENDDVSYTVSDLLPICRHLQIPLVYDVHHHRCLPDELTIPEASQAAAETWKSRKIPPHFHLSSPKNSWSGTPLRSHADYIDPEDFPSCWHDFDRLCIDVEAKAKELAIAKLQKKMAHQAKPAK